MQIINEESFDILIVSVFLILLMTVIFAVFLNKTLYSKYQILELFLALSPKITKILYHRCENFLGIQFILVS
jgi:hypothetical protein